MVDDRIERRAEVVGHRSQHAVLHGVQLLVNLDLRLGTHVVHGEHDVVLWVVQTHQGDVHLLRALVGDVDGLGGVAVVVFVVVGALLLRGVAAEALLLPALVEVLQLHAQRDGHHEAQGLGVQAGLVALHGVLEFHGDLLQEALQVGLVAGDVELLRGLRVVEAHVVVRVVVVARLHAQHGRGDVVEDVAVLVVARVHQEELAAELFLVLLVQHQQLHGHHC